jgi:hypothetical protein
MSITAVVCLSARFGTPVNAGYIAGMLSFASV